MTSIKQRLEDLLKEKKARAVAHAAVQVDEVPNMKTVAGEGKEKPIDGWMKFRSLSDEELEKKLKGLPEHELLELYKKLEADVNIRIDPENYKKHRIVKCFLLLWTRKKEEEELKVARGEVLVPLSDDEINQVMSNQGRKSSRLAPVSDKKNDEPF